MAPVKRGRYEYRRDSLREIRKQLGLSQGDMSKLLGVPGNTLSRWETGATVPDANSLAAVYSLAKEHGITPLFFSKVGRLVIMWDFQTLGIANYSFFPYLSGVSRISEADSSIRGELDKRFEGMTNGIFKAFIHPSQSSAGDELEKLRWRVWEGGDEIRQDIIDQARSDCGHDPARTTLVLITTDPGFVDLVDELMVKGVQVYIMTPQSYSNKLLGKVGQEHWIRWNTSNIDSPKRQLSL